MLLLCIIVVGLVVIVFVSRLRYLVGGVSVVLMCVSVFVFVMIVLMCLCSVGSVVNVLCRFDRLCGCVDSSVSCLVICLMLVIWCSVLCSVLRFVLVGVLSSVLIVCWCDCVVIDVCGG